MVVREEKEEFKSARPGSSGPSFSNRAFLKARQIKVDLEGKIGTTEIINGSLANVSSNSVSSLSTLPSSSVTDSVNKTINGVGWHCKICDCSLKDSLTYLDHINGRKHQRYLGYSMRVKKCRKEEVEKSLIKLAELRSRKKPNIRMNSPETNLNYDEQKYQFTQKKDKILSKRDIEVNDFQVKIKRHKIDIHKNGTDSVNENIASVMGFSNFGGNN